MNNPANACKEFMWNFLKDGKQRASLEEMQELTYLLTQAMTQMTAGQRSNKPNDIDYNRIDMITWQLAMSAMCLVLDTRFEKFKEFFTTEEE